MNLLDLALGSLYSRGPRGQGGQGWLGTGRAQRHHQKCHSPVYSGTDAGEEALLPFSQSRSRLPSRRLGDMRPDGDGALQGRMEGWRCGQWWAKPSSMRPKSTTTTTTAEWETYTCVVYPAKSTQCPLALSQPQSRCTLTQVQKGTFLGPVHQVQTIPLAHVCVLSALQWQIHSCHIILVGSHMLTHRL